MGHPRFTKEEICRRGEEIYEQHLRVQLDTKANCRKILIIDIETGDYEIDSDHLAASDRIHARHPAGAFFAMRIGFPSLAKAGGGWGMRQP